MSRVCQITGKHPSRGNNRSHACNATIRTFYPNLFKVRLYDPLTKTYKKVKISAKALKTLCKTK